MRISSDFVIWRWVETPVRILDFGFSRFDRTDFLIQGVNALIGPNAMMGIIYILAGAAK
jgi:hypothetical protein